MPTLFFVTPTRFSRPNINVRYSHTGDKNDSCTSVSLRTSETSHFCCTSIEKYYYAHCIKNEYKTFYLSIYLFLFHHRPNNRSNGNNHGIIIKIFNCYSFNNTLMFTHLLANIITKLLGICIIYFFSIFLIHNI